MKQLEAWTALSLGLALITSCAGDTTPEFTEVGVECSGKCDGLGSSIRSLWDAARRVDRGDLVNVTADLATDELNDALAFGGGAVGFDSPEIYALSDDAMMDLTLNDLDDLTFGLAFQYGERELTTAVNRARQGHLRDSSDVVFAEAAFRIEADVDHGWNFQAGGLLDDQDAVISVGFTAGAQLESRVIGAFDNEVRSNGSIMLEALRNGRGFVLPRSVDDIRNMDPGESVALSGEGAIGVNIGAGVPLLIAEPTSALTYNIILSAALRARLEGRLDVQLVRMEGDDLYVDVGTSRIFSTTRRLAIYDGWGVSGFIEAEVEIAGVTVNLGRVVERAIERQLDRQVNLIDGRLERTGVDSRVSVARFRFDLDQIGTDGERAIEQLLQGDIRLAQLLSNENEPGVHAEFDLLRSGESTTSYAGIDIFGLRFFRERIEASGSSVIQTPGGVRTVMFDSLHREGGWFSASHGFTRVGLSGLLWEPGSGAAPLGEANLFIQTVEGEGYFERHKMLHHIDAVLRALVGADSFAIIDGYGDMVEAHTRMLCPRPDTGSGCLASVLDDAETIRLRTDGLAEFTTSLGGLSDDQRNLAIDLGRMRLAAQATIEIPAGTTGPKMSVVTDYRIDDTALTHLFTQYTGAQFAAAVDAYLALAHYDETADAIAIAALFDAARNDYEEVNSAENATLDGFGKIGGNALEIRFEVDRDGAPDYDSATTQSLSQARAAVATRFFDDLYEEVRSLPGHPEKIVGYSILSLIPVESQDLRFDIRVDPDRFYEDHYVTAGYSNMDLYASGPRVSTIDGGLFNLDALLTVDE